MATIASANITYTLNYRRRNGNSKVYNSVTLTFGNGTLTYATGGIVLSGGSMGCPNNIESLTVADSGTSGYAFNYSLVTNKLLIYTAASHNHSLFVGLNTGTAATQAVNATTAGGLFQSGNGSTVAGIAAVAGTIGGIVTAQPSLALTELANLSAPASMSLTVEVVGW